MKIKYLACSCFFILILSSQANAEKINQANVITEFTKLAGNKGHDKNGSPVYLGIKMQCLDVLGNLSIDGSKGRAETKIEDKTYITFQDMPTFPDDVFPDSTDDATGWNYYFKNQNGYVTYLTENTGMIKLRIKAYKNGKGNEVEGNCIIKSVSHQPE